MLDCSHEEADTQMMVHLKHALSIGTQTIAIDSGGTDVLIILLAFFHQLKSKFSFIDILSVAYVYVHLSKLITFTCN